MVYGQPRVGQHPVLLLADAGPFGRLGVDPRHGLGDTLGFTALLHTWDQKLLDHIHLHCLIPGGALAPDGARWISARPGFLFPVKALSALFRGKFVDYLSRAFWSGRLRFPGKTAPLATPEAFLQLTQRLRTTPWVVYIKPSFPGPEGVLDYLARYTHRVAISNHRILDVRDGRVTFTYRDRKDGTAKKTLTLPASEFIRRFLLHVVPKGFVRIRHFGFLANAAKAASLPRARQDLGLPPEAPAIPETSTRDLLLQLTGSDPTLCPRCQRGTMRFVARIPPAPPLCATFWPALAFAEDTS